LLGTQDVLEIIPDASRLQMNPDSDYLRGLEADGLPAFTRMHSLWARGDEVIIPNESSILDGAINRRVDGLAPFAHSKLPRCTAAWDYILGLLR
jgi:hypothetical protein